MIKEAIDTHVAVVIPIHKTISTMAEDLSIRNTLSVLSNHHVYIICPAHLKDYVQSLKDSTGLAFDIKIFPDGYFVGLSSYSKLLMSLDFYRRFDRYEFILIVQLDAFVFCDELNYWCGNNYSYIGAPWFRGFSSPEIPLSFLGVGNGGFSLRKVHDCIEVLSTPRYISNFLKSPPQDYFNLHEWAKYFGHQYVFSYSGTLLHPRVFEDYFWGLLVPNRCDFFSVPEPEAAIAFAFEVAPAFLFELNGSRLPFGCHGWQKYGTDFWQPIIGQRAAVYKSTSLVR